MATQVVPVETSIYTYELRAVASRDAPTATSSSTPPALLLAPRRWAPAVLREPTTPGHAPSRAASRHFRWALTPRSARREQRCAAGILGSLTPHWACSARALPIVGWQRPEPASSASACSRSRRGPFSCSCPPPCVCRRVSPATGPGVSARNLATAPLPGARRAPGRDARCAERVPMRARQGGQCAMEQHIGRRSRRARRPNLVTSSPAALARSRALLGQPCRASSRVSR